MSKPRFSSITRRIRGISLMFVCVILIATLAGASARQVQAAFTADTAPVAAPGVPEAIVGSGFTYQGRLIDGGSPADGQYDFRFTLFDALSGGNQIGSQLTVSNQTVSNGLFTVSLDFGSNVYQGDARYLQIEVRQTGGGTYTLLSPRQSLTPAPYALSLRPGAVISSTLASPLFIVNNTGSNTGVYGSSNSGNGGEFSSATGTGVSATGGTGVYGTGTTNNGYGVFGMANSGSNAAGVYGYSSSGLGVYGLSTASNSYGVYGAASTGSNASGVYGLSASGYGIYGNSLATNGKGVYGVANTGSTASGVYGASTSGYGVYASGGTGVYATGGNGVYSTGTASNGVGLWGVANAGSTAKGVYGTSASGYGVYGNSTATNGTGVYGVAATGSGAIGVYGASTAGAGVYGSSSSGNAGYFASTSGTGVYGSGGVSGVYGTSSYTDAYGIWGVADTGANARGVYGYSGSGYGLFGGSGAGPGIYGTTSANNGSGILGYANVGSQSSGVAGISSNGYGVYGSSGNWAGYFQGNVNVTGTCCAQSEAYTRIDDPADPENKYLNQSLVQSPDMLSMINGNATLDTKGEAAVTLPAWFGAGNSDYRYTLTAVGAPGPDLYISQELSGGTFKIAGGKAGGKVSWQITGIRKDPYAVAHPVQPETDKSADDRGKYAHPTEYGQPESKGINSSPNYQTWLSKP